MLEVAGDHGRKHCLATFATPHHLRSNHHHHNPSECLSAVLFPGPSLVDLNASGSQRRDITLHQRMVVSSALLGNETGTAEVGEVNDR